MAMGPQLMMAMTLLAILLPLSFADRCREICEKVHFADQCGTCLGRAPVRFGKRSSPEANILLRELPPLGSSHLLSLLLERAARVNRRLNVPHCD